MGCHTWFRNRISDMPQEHFDIFVKRYIEKIKNAYIYRCSLDKWQKSCDNILNDIEKQYSDEEKKTSKAYKDEIKMYTKMRSEEYYQKTHKRYAKDLEILQNPKSSKKQVFRVFSRHDFMFKLNKDTTDGTYSLEGFGWHDEYRVTGYPPIVHHNAQEAIEWLESYDNGHNIYCNYTEGMSDEIRDIINMFFKEYPNGTINYG